VENVDRPRLKPAWHARVLHAPGVLWILALGVSVRAIALAARWDRLLADPDSYWRYARAIWLEGTYLGSAYRPPGYPVLLALACFAGEGGRQFAVAVLHLVLAALAIWATLACVRQLGFGRPAAIAAGLVVALDPLAIYWVTEVMTETATTALVAVFCLLVVAVVGCVRPGLRVVGWTVVGALAAATLLTRPDVGLGAVALAAVVLASSPGSARLRGAMCAAFVAGGLLVWGPWIVRNYRLSGALVPLTTHGGYTAALGNNRLWYDVLRQRGILATYRPDELRQLQRTLLRGFQGGRAGRSQGESRLRREVAYDRHCYQVALAAVLGDQGGFLRAACHRLLVLWRLSPARPLPTAVRWALAAWYLAMFGAAVAALTQATLERNFLPVAPLVLLGLTLTTVHVVYWSEMRMRTPLVPAFAVAIAFLCERRGRRGVGAEDGSSNTQLLAEDHGNG